MASDFIQLGIRPELQHVLAGMGVTEPTPVQAQAIPLLLAGKDVAAQAQTGTGKTFAFILPILERLEPRRPYTQALIVTPTRELAGQIARETAPLAAVVDADVTAAYGGQDMDRQTRKLGQTPAIVIGTPGRLLDHIKRGSLTLSGVRLLVLDEADEMLRRGFLEEIESLIVLTSEKRQTMLFSATMPQQIRQLAERYMRKPEQLRIHGKQVTVEDIEQSVVETPELEKTATLVRLLQQYNPFLAMVFCSSKGRATAVNSALQEKGIASDTLHGDLSQAKRELVLRRFRDAKLQVLVATDIAARGLDIEGVTHVFNYDVPQDMEWYIHRIGRTGRAGESGVAVTLATQRDKIRLAKLESKIGMKLTRRDLEGNVLASAVSKGTGAKGAKRAGSTAHSSGKGGSGRRGRSQDAAGAPKVKKIRSLNAWGAGRSTAPRQGQTTGRNQGKSGGPRRSGRS